MNNKHDQNKCKSKFELSQFLESGTSNCINQCSGTKKITLKDNENIYSYSSILKVIYIHIVIQETTLYKLYKKQIFMCNLVQ